MPLLNVEGDLANTATSLPAQRKLPLSRIGYIAMTFIGLVLLAHNWRSSSGEGASALRGFKNAVSPSSQRKLSNERISFFSCKSGEREKIEKAHGNAIRQVEKALDELPGGKHSEFNRDLRYWFGKDSERDDVALKNAFVKMKYAMEFEDIEYHCTTDDICAGKWNPFKTGAVAFINKHSRPYKISFCPGFFGGIMPSSDKISDTIFPREPEGVERNGAAHIDVGQLSRPGIIVHEFSHHEDIADTEDHTYGFAFEDLHRLVENNPAKAQSNAMNWNAFTETGPCWDDGRLCGLGSTCKNCCAMKATYWVKKAMTACGRESCWKKGTVCGKGTTCKLCCDGSKKRRWWKAGISKCK